MERLISGRHRANEPDRRPATPPDHARRRALARLYARRSAVRNLIGALEQYQQEQSLQRARCGVLTDLEKSS